MSDQVEINKATRNGYVRALQDIVGGKSPDAMRAEMVLPDRIEPPPKHPRWEFWNWRMWPILGANLTAIVALIVALSGGVFSYYQHQNNERKVEADERIAKAEILNKLAPSLTSLDSRTRILAYSTLLSVAEIKTEELKSMAVSISDPIDAEIVEIIVRKLPEDSKPNFEKAAELFAKRSETNRRGAEETNLSEKLKNERILSSRSDAEHALELDPDNLRARYQLSALDQYAGKFKDSERNLNKLVQQIESMNDGTSNELYLRALIRLTETHEALKLPSSTICESIAKVETAYKVANQWDYLRSENEFWDRKREFRCK